MSIRNKVVVITGASSGIGSACAIAFAEAGCKVVLCARSLEKLQIVVDQIKSNNGIAIAIGCDVTVESDCKNLIEASVAAFGGIDILICNAGISMRALFQKLDLNVIHKLMNTNFWGTVYCAKYALPHLLKNNGSLVGISSVAGKKGLPGRTGYSASKFAMEGFLESLRIEYLKKGLHVLVACPNFTESEIRSKALMADGTEQGHSPRNEKKLMPANEVADSILKAVIKRKRDIIFTPLGKLTVWVNYFLPSMVDRIVYNQMAKEPDSPFK